MSENTPPGSRQPSDAEVVEFRALGLTPGHWAALAPVPLFRHELRAPERHEFRILHTLRECLRTLPQLSGEAEQFWHKLCQSQLEKDGLTIAYALLGWHLATDSPRARREEFLGLLDRAIDQFRSRASIHPRPNVVRAVRKWIDAYLPCPDYVRHPDVPPPAPPSPTEVATLFGPDLWKQCLVAPIAAALTARNARPPDVLHVVRRLANVTESEHSLAYPLEPHLHPGWRQLFVGLLPPLHRAEGEQSIREGMTFAARGLASLGFEEREQIFDALGEELKKAIGLSGSVEDRNRAAESWINRLRERVEGVLWVVRSHDSAPTAPPVSTASLAPVTPPLEPVPSLTESRPVAIVVPVRVVSPSPPPPHTFVAPTHLKSAVERANPFTMVTFDEALALASEVTVAGIRAWLENPDRPKLLFDDRRQECSEVAIVRDPKLVPPVLWIVGDLHADVLTLANVIAHAERVAVEGEPPSFLFLGDFVDRGRHDHETLLLLFRLILKHPDRVCILPGNHDVDLQWGEKSGKFGVTIEPAEYCEKLNAILLKDDSDSRDRVELARLLIPFWQSRPKALILPDGTLFAHAGFPHTDTHPTLRVTADLARPHCLSDFLWARIAETARKRPNRGNRGHEFGWETFAQFAKVTSQLGVPTVKRFVRGHDHVPARWQFYPDYAENPVLTINAMGRRMDGEPEPADGPHPLPVMARYVPNQLPVVVRLPLDPVEVNRAFGRDKPKNGDSPPLDQIVHELSRAFGGDKPASTEGVRAQDVQPATDPVAQAGGETLDVLHSNPKLPGVAIDDFPGGVQVDPSPASVPNQASDVEPAGGGNT